MGPILFVGLGNPGPQYAQTRHNAGWMAVELLASRWGLTWSDKKRLSGTVAEGMVPGGRAVLLKPTTYMNDSGRSVRAALDLYKFTPAELLVIYDDVALPMGTLRLRPSGSAGGHNGLRSLESHLGTRDYPRLRIGIDPKPERMDLADYVLGKFSPDQQTKLPAVLDGCIEAIELIRREGFDKAMSLVNAKNFG